ncbi:uncharacterized protein LOC121294869 [Polyodon spathula]|uniref:uncharacterized protein LOC121294869 n=1 Tax=Polyodon spathula TaxID=7913 RepID=UPI001B7DB441|nr:uncharacterized protein LOC121294869 [Polyodon spathula]
MKSFVNLRTSRLPYISVRHAVSSTQPTRNADFYRQRTIYSYFLPIQSRWQDNDQYGHVNNAVYHGYFDTLINHYLIRYCGLNTNRGSSSMVGFIVTNQCSFHKPVKFPENPLASLAVEKIGRSSVLYRMALFNPFPTKKSISIHFNILNDGCFSDCSALEGFESLACATAMSTHVFVDPTSEKPKELPEGFKKGLQKIMISP